MLSVEIIGSNRYGKLAPATLAAFERSLGLKGKLPAPYRSHLLRHNGGCLAGAEEADGLDAFPPPAVGLQARVTWQGPWASTPATSSPG